MSGSHPCPRSAPCPPLDDLYRSALYLIRRQPGYLATHSTRRARSLVTRHSRPRRGKRSPKISWKLRSKASAIPAVLEKLDLLPYAATLLRNNSFVEPNR